MTDNLSQCQENLEKLQKKNNQLAEGLLHQLDEDLKKRVARKIIEAREKIELSAEEESREILIEAMRHGVTDLVAEYSVSTIEMKDESMKGKIIGREGRNIRVFEKVTGVDLELDEDKEVRLSSFDSVRREIAKKSLQKLIKDGRIQPSRIEDIVERTKKEVEQIIFNAGKELVEKAGVYNLSSDLVKILGRFKFRFSFGQNMIVHTLEETQIGVNIAEELKANVDTVRLGCLLHDIGKVIVDKEGSHVQLGVDLLKKYHLPEEVIACVAEHHEARPFSSVESTIVWIADAISGSRPGARYQPHEDYIKRMEEIEKIAASFDGVEDVAAYQAGREVRVIVSPEKVNDEETEVLAYEIAKKLEEQARWAGQIRVTVIREVRKQEVAPLES